MIDADGFRANVGIILANTQGQVLWAKRVGHDSWQFPQGGIDAGETPVDAMYRELWEEVGLSPHHVELLAVTDDWLRYRLPKRFVRHGQFPLCIGQKQKWFLLRLDEPNTKYIRFDIDKNSRPEFDHWEWVSYWYPLGQVVHFKRGVYRRALQQLARNLPLKPALRVNVHHKKPVVQPLQKAEAVSSSQTSAVDHRLVHDKVEASKPLVNRLTDKLTYSCANDDAVDVNDSSKNVRNDMGQGVQNKAVQHKTAKLVSGGDVAEESASQSSQLMMPNGRDGQTLPLGGAVPKELMLSAIKHDNVGQINRQLKSSPSQFASKSGRFNRQVRLAPAQLSMLSSTQVLYRQFVMRRTPQSGLSQQEKQGLILPLR